MSIFVPQGPTIPPSVNFSTMYSSLASITTQVSNQPQQFQVVVPNNSLAVSQDGSTAVVGNSSGVGFISIWINIGSTWIQQAGPLVGTGNTGNSQQGTSVAISANGNTVITGGPSNNSNAGAVWVWVRTGTSWTQQAGPLVGTGAIGNAIQGYSVSLSASGNTAIWGGYDDNGGIGATWVFTRTGTTWSQLSNKLVGTGYIGTPDQGTSVAISADGLTLAVGGDEDNSSMGATWIFVNVLGTWTQQAKLVGTGVIGSYSYQGYSVSLSGNGPDSPTLILIKDIQL